MESERSSFAVEEELERRSKFLKSLIEQKKNINNKTTKEKEEKDNDDDIDDVAAAMMVRVRASDMSPAMKNHAFRFARAQIEAKLDSKRIAHALKKEFDIAYGPAWHCIVGKSFGSYVTHSVGGFLYFSIDKLYVLLFKTAVEPLEHH